MTFLNSILFWSGFALAAGPVLIHLLNRRRFQVLDWAAMNFLLESVRKNRRRIQIEEWLLLLLRVLAILLMGLALARPFVGEHNLSAVLGMKAHADHVVVLDDSYSMAQRLGTETIFDRARSALLKLAERVGPEDTFTVLRVSRPDAPVFATGPLTDLATFKKDIQGLTPSDFATDLLIPLEKARLILADTKHPEKKLYLLTDFRQRDWDFAPTGGGQKIRAILDKFEKTRLKIFFLDLGLSDPANLGITEFVAEDKHIVQGMRAQFHAAITNHGAIPVHHVPVCFTVGGEKFSARGIDTLAAGQTAVVKFSYTFSGEGSQAMTVELPSDALIPDNKAFLAFEVRADIPVLVVNGAPDEEPYRNEPDYFLAALDPGGKGLSGYRPRVVTEAMLPHVKFSDFDAVILANLSRMPRGKLAELEAFVAAGGGLGIFLGDRIDRDFYNNEFFNEGKGLQPLHLEPARGDALDPEKFVRLKVEDASHPVLGIFAGFGGALLDRAHFRSYYPSQKDDETSVKSLALFTDREQNYALVEKSFGKGKVLLWTSTLSAHWNDWPRNPSYPIAMNECVAYLARPPQQVITAPLGVPLRSQIEPEYLNAKITLRTPVADQDPVRLLPKPEGEMFFVHFDATPNAGLYQLDRTQPGKARRDYFARNLDSREGDLVKIDATALTHHLQEYPIEYQTDLASHEFSLPEEAPGKEFWRYLLFGLLGLLVVESMLALRFGHYAK